MLQNSWKSWLAFLTRQPLTNLRRLRRTASHRPEVETLEHRCLLSGSTISGAAFIDATGNGLAAGDAAQSNVSIQLFRDSNHDGRFDFGDILVASQRTALDGSYAFKNLSSGKYFVTESSPAGWVQTTPTVPSFYSVTLGANQVVANQNFANFHTPNTGVITHVSFTITDPTRGTYTVPDLRGNTHEGDTVTANFRVTGASSVLVSFEVYDAPGATFNANTASQQVIVMQDSVLLSPGSHSLTIHTPDNFYQIDLVLGAPITTLGPAGSNVFYSAQGRLISADNEGNRAFAPGSLSGNISNDVNTDGVLDGGDQALAGVKVTLAGTNDLGQAVTLSTLTDSSGNYRFSNLRQGTYTVTQTPPTGFNAESGSVGSLGGAASATVISGISLQNGQSGTSYNFLEVDPPQSTTYSISGTVIGGTATTVSITDNNTGAAYTATINAANGAYSMSGLPAGDTYTIVPNGPGFTPKTTNPLTANLANENFQFMF